MGATLGTLGTKILSKKINKLKYQHVEAYYDVFGHHS